MSYLNLIKPFQSVDLSNHFPFFIGDEHVGWIRKNLTPSLEQFADVFICDDNRVTLHPNLHDFNSRSDAVKNALSTLADQGVVKHSPFNESNPVPAFRKPDIFPIGSDPFNAPLMGIERYYGNLFGVMRYNISVIGHCGQSVWIAKRSDKVQNPNKLDHMISGCCTTAHNIANTVADEAHDEAGFTPDMIEKITPMTVYDLINLDKNGDVMHEQVNLFEIELPNDYTPVSPQPDEIAGFENLSFDALNDEILNHDNLLYFSKIVFIYFLIKEKYITEKNTEYINLINAFQFDPSDIFNAY